MQDEWVHLAGEDELGRCRSCVRVSILRCSFGRYGKDYPVTPHPATPADRDECLECGHPVARNFPEKNPEKVRLGA